MGVVAAGACRLDPGPPAAWRHPWPPPRSFPLVRQAAADPPGMAAAVADSHANCGGRRRAAATRVFGDRGRRGPVELAAGRPDSGTGPGTPWAAAHGRGSAGG